VTVAETLVWLELIEGADGGVSVAVPLDEALDWTEKDFAKLYRRTLYGSKKKEAREWGREQVKKRDEALQA
jgi:hypothetical protein